MIRTTFRIASLLLLGCSIKFSNSYPANRIGRFDPEENLDLIEGDIIPNGLQGRSEIINPDGHWPNATVAYQFDTNYEDDLKSTVMKAMNHITHKTDNCVRFVPRTDEDDYIVIDSLTRGCSSYVGRVGGNQRVSLPPECDSIGIHIHELVHVLGFGHEQSRPDRDNYVEIHLENVLEGMQHNFEKYSSEDVSTFEVGYDYSSIMHYGKYAFTKNGLPTIVPKDAGQFIGQRKFMSKSDIQKVKNMYGCE